MIGSSSSLSLLVSPSLLSAEGRLLTLEPHANIMPHMVSPIPQSLSSNLRPNLQGNLSYHSPCLHQERRYGMRNSQRAVLEGDNDWTVRKRLKNNKNMQNRKYRWFSFLIFRISASLQKDLYKN